MSTSESTPAPASTTAPTPAPAAFEVTITAEAAAKVLEIMGSQDELSDDEKNLRLFVDGMGCGGPAFGMVFDKRTDEDVSCEAHGLTVVCDPMSLQYVNGSEVDFVDNLEVTGFKVTSPNAVAPDCASSGCGDSGCGPSSGGCC